MFSAAPRQPIQVFLFISMHALLFFLFTPFAYPIHGDLLAFSFVWFSLSSSLYYHRSLTHRSFEMILPLQLFFLLGGLIGLGGDPVQWSSIHRFHHQNSDSEVDPHSPKRGFWWALWGWYLRLNSKSVYDKTRASEDLKQYWWLRIAQGSGPSALVHTAFALYLFLHGGPSLLLWGLYFPILLSIYCSWALIASFCHTPSLGKQLYPETKDNSRNLVWLAPFTFGESLHNTHHRFPSNYRLSNKIWDIDLSGWIIEVLIQLRLARPLRDQKGTSS